MRQTSMLIIVALFACSRYTWQAPVDIALKGEFRPVPEGEPHGTLVVKRNNARAIYVLIDGKPALRDYETTEATLRVVPGKHSIRLRVSASVDATIIVAQGKQVTAEARLTGAQLQLIVTPPDALIRE